TADIATEIADISLTEAYRADELFCTGTMGELAAITQLDGRRIGNGAAGPMTLTLSRSYRAEARKNGTPIV
ncbi:MAG: aminotransferase IV, partial [Acidobacteriota bacterium]|nr:aminotransferase IV [Acidobacteriota bacterium]